MGRRGAKNEQAAGLRKMQFMAKLMSQTVALFLLHKIEAVRIPKHLPRPPLGRLLFALTQMIKMKDGHYSNLATLYRVAFRESFTALQN